MKRISVKRPIGIQRAFTLVELLVAMSVLFGVTLLITTLISNVTRTVEIGERSVDADYVARAFFNRFGSDLSNILIHPDVQYGIEKRTGDDRLTFFATQTSPLGSERPISLVSYYRFRPSSAAPQELQRAVHNPNSIAPTGGTADPAWYAGIFYETPSLAVPLQTGSSITTTIGVDASGASYNITDDFQSFGSEIIRFEYNLLVEDPSTGTVEVRDDLPSGTRISHVKGLIVAIAVLDSKIAARLSSSDIDLISAALSDVGTSGGADTMGRITSVWRDDLAGYASGPDVGGDAGNAVDNVRLYQRAFFFQR